jgi:hypothetical protein
MNAVPGMQYAKMVCIFAGAPPHSGDHHQARTIRSEKIAFICVTSLVVWPPPRHSAGCALP